MSLLRSTSAIRLTLLLLLTFVPVRTAWGQEIGEAGIKDPERAMSFCKELQHAVSSGEKTKVATWISGYPIEVQHGAKSILVGDDSDFIDKFDLVFDTDTKSAVLAAGACNMPPYPSGTVKIAGGQIEIYQTENGLQTFILTISPPSDSLSLYENNDVYEAGAAEFFRKLRQAVSTNDRRLISNLCRYPLSVNVGGKHREIKNRAALLAEYPRIFTSEVKQAVLALEAPIHAGWRGFMTERGELWIDLVVGTHVFRVGTINGGYLPSKDKPPEPGQFRWLPDSRLVTSEVKSHRFANEALTMRKIALLWVGAFALTSIPAVCNAQVDTKWEIHDRNRPVPPVVDPGTASTQDAPGRPPADAVVLFDGKDLSQWVQKKDGSPAKWKVENGYFEVVPKTGDIQTRESFGDCQLHVEFAEPSPAKGEDQDRGNSGVFLQGLYETQVLDSYQSKTYADGQAAAIYGQYPPLVNASRPPGQWQTYDIIFHGPRFDASGKLTRPARETVFHNGVLVQDNAELTGPTGHHVRPPYKPGPEKLPLALQDHNHPVRYRNIWIRELKSAE